MAWLGVTFFLVLFVFPALFLAFVRLALVVLLIATCMAANQHDPVSAIVLALTTGLVGAFSGFGFRRAA